MHTFQKLKQSKMEPLAPQHTRSDSHPEQINHNNDETRCQAMFLEFKNRLYSYNTDINNLGWSLFSTSGCDNITNFSFLRNTFIRWLSDYDFGVQKMLLNPTQEQRDSMKVFWGTYIEEVDRTLNHGMGPKNVFLFCLRNNCFKDLKNNIV